MADIFGDQPINDDVTVDVLVGEGKKYNDVNNLAKAYVNAEGFIEELKRDLAMERAQKDANNLNNADVNAQQVPQSQTPTASPEPVVKPQDVDLRKLVSEELQNLTQSTRFEQNVESTAQRMVEVYGSASKAQEALAQKARELGVGIDWLRDAAARSPQAFYNTMGITSETSSPTNRSTPSPHSDVRVSVDLSNGGEKNYNYFEKIRKENKSLYYSAAIQNEMQKLAREKGDSFYS